MREWTTENGNRVTKVLHGWCNCYLIETGENRLLVDTGGARDWARLAAGLEHAGVLRGGPLDLALTHTHYDHAENVASVTQVFGATVIVHRSEAPMLAAGRGPVPVGTIGPTRFLMRMAGDRARGWFAYRPVAPDIVVDEALDLSDRGHAVRLIHTPGHTAGSISVLVDDEVAIVGDALVGVVPFDIFPPFGEDAAEIVRSWGILLDTGCRVFLPAHGSARDRPTVEKHFRRLRNRWVRESPAN